MHVYPYIIDPFARNWKLESVDHEVTNYRLASIFLALMNQHYFESEQVIGILLKPKAKGDNSCKLDFHNVARIPCHLKLHVCFSFHAAFAHMWHVFSSPSPPPQTSPVTYTQNIYITA